MNASDWLILDMGASTRDIGGVLMQVQGGRVKPCIFVSHTLSEQATRCVGGGVMELIVLHPSKNYPSITLVLCPKMNMGCVISS